MKTSQTVTEIFKALISFQSNKPNIDLNTTVSVKTKAGGSYTFKYATLSHVLKECQPLLTKNKIGYTHAIDEENNLITTIIHESGEWLQSVKPLDLPSNSTAQEVGSFITYYKRYSLLGMLGVIAEDDEDGNIASGNTAKKREISIWANDSDVDKILSLIDSGEIDRAKDGLKYWESENRGISKERKSKILNKIK